MYTVQVVILSMVVRVGLAEKVTRLLNKNMEEVEE